jgi:hypothetical protein
MEPSTFIKRRFLGTFSEKIHKEKLAKGQRKFGQPLSTEKTMCGIYERGAVLKNIRMKFCPNQRNFYFLTEVLTNKERELMQDIPSVMTKKKDPMYSCNPYNCEIGQVKLFLDVETGEVKRCMIEDLYCVEKLGKLDLRVDILLIDDGETIRFVNNKHIYDFSQRIGYLAETEGEAKLARLHLKDADDDDDEIHSILEEFIESSPRDLFDLKICDYDQEDCIYLVDLVTKDGTTYLEQFKKRRQKLLMKSTYDLIDISAFNLDIVKQSLPKTTSKRRAIKQNDCRQSHFPTNAPYHGAFDYFKKQVARQNRNRDDCFMKRKIVNVAVLDWYGPHQLAIVPLDKEYTLGHQQFVDSLSSLKCFRDAENSRGIRIYQPGEYVVFKNVFADKELGRWLRGVVVSMSCYNEHNLVIAQRKTFKEKSDNFKVVKRLVQDKKLLADDLTYRVRSVDYGCECRCSPINMRYVDDLEEFKRIGTWSLRCRLFGIQKFQGEERFSRETNQVFDNWLRQKILDNGSTNKFQMIIRCNWRERGGPNMFDMPIDISLFHKYDPSKINYMEPKKVYLELINWYLVEKGLASSIVKGKNSNIQLENHVIRVLVGHGKI